MQNRPMRVNQHKVLRRHLETHLLLKKAFKQKTGQVHVAVDLDVRLLHLHDVVHRAVVEGFVLGNNELKIERMMIVDFYQHLISSIQ